jgi:hypothetical protein
MLVLFRLGNDDADDNSKSVMCMVAVMFSPTRCRTSSSTNSRLRRDSAGQRRIARPNRNLNTGEDVPDSVGGVFVLAVEVIKGTSYHQRDSGLSSARALVALGRAVVGWKTYE